MTRLRNEMGEALGSRSGVEGMSRSFRGRPGLLFLWDTFLILLDSILLFIFVEQRIIKKAPPDYLMLLPRGLVVHGAGSSSLPLCPDSEYNNRPQNYLTTNRITVA